MNQEDIKRLEELVTAGEPREIPSSEECRNRMRVVISAINEKETREETIDGVLVGSERLMLVWKWEKRLGANSEESPAEFLLLPYSAGQLVEISRGLFRLDRSILFETRNGRWRQSEGRSCGLL